MGKLIAEKIEEAQSSIKMVEIKHTRTMQDASGKNVEVIDYIESKPLDDAISETEARKTSIEAQLVDVEAELADFIAIRDAE